MSIFIFIIFENLEIRFSNKKIKRKRSLELGKTLSG
jgi:hypothetical protein